MRDVHELEALLHRMDGRGYGAYKDLVGAWRFDDFALHVDHVQGDPFAAPSRVRATLEAAVAGLPAGCLRTPARMEGTASCLADRLSSAARHASASTGSGRSGEVRAADPGQQVLPQTAVLLDPTGAVEARLTIGLPARGRRVLARQAVALLTRVVPGLVRETLSAAAHDPDALELWAATNEDAHHLRGLLTGLDLVAFVADGSRLPRRSGVDDRPLDPERAVPFESPESLRRTVELPNAGTVSGMGVPRGVTLIVGGGFHGKSTLLRALETGVYNHRPGDGRERAVTAVDAVKIRAEDGRSVAGVDISPFIDNLPMDQDTRSFSSSNASGSTSQAAAIVEALEAGAGVLLVDEDTSATNFMIRDRRMQALVPKEREPITPFIDRVRELHTTHGVSSVLVLGGSGDYLDVADTVVAMESYRPRDVSAEAREVASTYPTGRHPEKAPPLVQPAPRRPDMGSLDPSRGRRDVSLRVPDGRTLLFGAQEVDLAAVEQIVSRGQITAMGRALVLAKARLEGAAPTVSEILDLVEAVVGEGGLDSLDDRHPGDLVAFRRFELAAALNRLRTLRV